MIPGNVDCAKLQLQARVMQNESAANRLFMNAFFWRLKTKIVPSVHRQ